MQRCLLYLSIVCLLSCSSKDQVSKPTPPPKSTPKPSTTITPENYGPMRDLIALNQKAAREARKREDSGLASTCNRSVPCSANSSGINEAIQAFKSRFEGCFAAWQRLNPVLPQHPTIEFHLSPTGQTPPRSQISQIRIPHEGIGNPFFRGCLIAALSDLYFGASPASGLKLLSPLGFTPKLGPDHHH